MFKKLLSVFLAALMVLSMTSFVVMAEEGEVAGPAELVQPVGVYFDGDNALEPVVLGKSEQTVWEGNVPNNIGNEYGASGVTFVYEVDGVNTPIKPGAWDAGFNGTLWSTGNWFWNNAWGGWANQVVSFEESGLYYTFLPSRIATSSPKLIKDVTSFTLFKNGAGNPVILNENENATFRMLAVIENNLAVTVNFYGINGEFLGTASHKYTHTPVVNGPNADWTDLTASHGKLMTPVELASTIEGIELPTKENDGDVRYDLIFKDEDGNKVKGLYKSLNLYADFEAVDDTVAKYKFVDVKGEFISNGVAKKGDSVVYDGAKPEKAAEGEFFYIFKCWSVDGEEIDLASYKLSKSNTVFEPVFTQHKEGSLPVELKQPVGVFFDGEDAHTPITLGSEEQVVWEGSVPNNTLNSYGASGVTLVYKVDGIVRPIKTGGWDLGYDGRFFSTGNWFYTNLWTGIYAGHGPVFDKNGLYYTFLPSRVATASPKLIKDVTSFTLFKSGVAGGATIVNSNEGATLQMLAVIENNLKVTVNFFGTDGEFLGTASHQYTNTPVVNGANADWTAVTVSHGKLKTPLQLAKTINGIELPTKASDDTYRYELIFRDAEGNKVEGLYKSLDLYADFEPVDKNVADYAFVDADGELIIESEAKKGETALFDGEIPEKAEDADYTYTFKCWSVDGEEVDLDTYELSADYTTFVPVFVEDLILKAGVSADKLTAVKGDKINLSFTLNRGDLTDDVVAGIKEDITFGKIVVTYNDAFFSAVDGVDGTIEMTFDEIAEDGTLNVTLTLDVITEFASVSDVSVQAYVDTDSFVEYEAVGAKVTINTEGGRQMLSGFGTYPYNEKVVLIGERFIPAVKSDVLTLVYEVNGLNGGTLYFGGVQIQANGHNSNHCGEMWDNKEIAEGKKSHQMGIITEDGVYAVQIGVRRPQWNSGKYEFINYFSVSDGSSSRGGAMSFIPAEGDEENVPTITYHAVFVGDFAANISYVDGDEVVSYVEYSGTDSGEWSIDTYKISTVNDLFDGEIPLVKESEIKEVEYVFDGWADKDGNKVEVVLGDTSVYPIYKEVDNRTLYNVVFKNYDGTVLYETVVPEGVAPEYDATVGTPKKPSTDTNSYKFIGWDPELAPTPATPEADGATAPDAIVYTAKYEETERTYDIIYYDERGKNVLFEELYLSYGSAAGYDGIPEKEADVKYTYTFDKWVTLDGEEVDLSSVVTDLNLKPSFTPHIRAYTVIFMNGEEKIGEATANYGEGVEAPKATKDNEGYYRFDFTGWITEDGKEANLDAIRGHMTVYATFDKVFVSPFGDIDTGSWYAPAVEYVIVNGIMNGMGAGFEPNTNMSRAMVVTVLYRYTANPENGDAEVSFTDVKDGQWYTEAIAWAASNGVVNGRGNGKFDPNGNVTRQEFCAILYRYADKINDEYMGFGKSTVASFADKNEIDSWAISAIKWAFATEADMDTTAPGNIPYAKTQYVNGKGSLNGKPLMAPKANATRAEVATMLYRYMTGVRVPKE